MLRNSFQFVRANAINIRGKPRVAGGTVIRDNVFAQEHQDDAIELQTTENVQSSPNVTGFDSYGQYGVCDFDGDGKDNLFLASGATWWYSSGANVNWTF